MKKSTKLSQAALAVALLFTTPTSGLAGQFFGQVQLENDFDADHNRETAIEPRIQYREKNWRTHLEWQKPVHPESEDGGLEWEYEYFWKGENQRFSLRHELSYDLEKNRTRAELTPRWYYRPSKTFRAGIELELDYYDNDARDSLELNHAEIEPTVKWLIPGQRANLTIEIEAPVLRLYSNDPEEDSVEFVGVEPIITYDVPFRDRGVLEFELRLPYDTIDNELETQLNIAWIWAF